MTLSVIGFFMTQVSANFILHPRIVKRKIITIVTKQIASKIPLLITKSDALLALNRPYT